MFGGLAERAEAMKLISICFKKEHGSLTLRRLPLGLEEPARPDIETLRLSLRALLTLALRPRPAEPYRQSLCRLGSNRS